ncbi:hypothetical protein JL720_9988 [Aureococcus anophagefferens]|nr:hypothetical protein JL720_9988 [Aureococcus anophagefferens]
MEDVSLSAKRASQAQSTRMMIAARLNSSLEAGEASAKFWIPADDPVDLWRLVDITALDGDGNATLAGAPEGEEPETVVVSVAQPWDESHDKDLRDVCEMADLHQAPLLAMLRRRWKAGHIYTAAGNVLCSINPYRDLGGDVYDVPATLEAMVDTFGGAEGEPHLFRWAHVAYDALWKAEGAATNQAIICNGESGAGKTMASTLIAFGNAKTAMNDNSSRFGKFLLLEYEDKVLCGLGGAAGETYGVASADRHHYLNQHELVVPGVDDLAEAGDAAEAFAALGQGEAIAWLRRVCAGLVRLGDVDFEDVFDDSAASEARPARQRHELACVDKANKDHPSTPSRGRTRTFVVRHYAGDVAYTAHGFLTRNVDPLSGDAAECLRSSKDGVLAAWYPAAGGGEEARQAQRRALSESTSKKFREQMAALSEELDECEKHYVRCIRPNGSKDRNVFDMDMVLRQLRFFGLLDIVKIRRLGYPEQSDPATFWKLLALIRVRRRPRHAFERLLPATVLASGGSTAPTRPRAADGRADWDAKREPLLKQIETLEAARTKAAGFNEAAKVAALAADLKAVKARDEHGECRPPDVAEACVMLCTMLLDEGEFAIGTKSGQLFTKLGVTRRLDEMLALAMGLEAATSEERAAQLSALASDRVDAEEKASSVLQSISRGRKQGRRAARARRADAARGRGDGRGRRRGPRARALGKQRQGAALHALKHRLEDAAGLGIAVPGVEERSAVKAPAADAIAALSAADSRDALVAAAALASADALLAVYEASVHEGLHAWLSRRLAAHGKRHDAVVAEAAKVGGAKVEAAVDAARDALAAAEAQATHAVEAAEAAVRGEEALFETTAKTRALNDLEEAKQKRACFRPARRAPGDVLALPDLAEALAAADAALSADGGAQRRAARRGARADKVDALARAVEEKTRGAFAATKMETKFRARHAHREYAHRKAAAKKLEAVSRGLRRRQSLQVKKASALVLETAMRGKAARAQFARSVEARRQRAATRLQAWWRCVDERGAYHFVLDLTKKWASVIRDAHPRAKDGAIHEFVVLHTIVLWHKYTQAGRVGEFIGSRKLHMVVAFLLEKSGARAVTVDDSSTVVDLSSLPSGREHPWSSRRGARAAAPCVFRFKHKQGFKSSNMHLTDLCGTFNRWVTLKMVFDQRAWDSFTPKKTARLNLDVSVANLPVDAYGFLYKKPFKRQTRDLANAPPEPPPADAPSPATAARRTKSATRRASAALEGSKVAKEEKSRFFILQGGMLRYFKHEADDVPKGQLCLPEHGPAHGRASATVAPGPEDGQFVVKTPELPEGLVVRGADPADAAAWMDAIAAAAATDLAKKQDRIKRKAQSWPLGFRANATMPRAPSQSAGPETPLE